MSVADNLKKIKETLPKDVTLIAVSKTKPAEMILEAYNAGHRDFGENKVQEMVAKYEQLPKDIRWHQIGHLQTNKVKYIAPFVYLIHSVDSLKLLKEINKRAEQNNRIIQVLLQIYIAQEETKFGLSFEEAQMLLKSEEVTEMQHIKIVGFMGMATNTVNQEQIKKEFCSLKSFYEKTKIEYPEFKYLSMGMSSDYKIALQCGSNMIRVGSAVFGERFYGKQ
jgi:hypothetical protein